MAAHRVDITGRRYGHLLALEPIGKNAKREWLWRCVCDCGTDRVVGVGHLSAGLARHCGCKTSANHRAAQRRQERRYKTDWERRKRASARPSPPPVARPNNGPLDVFLYGHPAP